MASPHRPWPLLSLKMMLFRSSRLSVHTDIESVNIYKLSLLKPGKGLKRADHNQTRPSTSSLLTPACQAIWHNSVGRFRKCYIADTVTQQNQAASHANTESHWPSTEIGEINYSNRNALTALTRSRKSSNTAFHRMRGQAPKAYEGCRSNADQQSYELYVHKA